MKATNHDKRHRTPAFTLIEILVVMAIIAVLATMVVGGMGWYKRKAAVGKTTILTAGISRALEDYRLDHNFFPYGDGGDDSSEQVYIALYGDGELESDGSGNVTIKTSPTGKPDEGNTVYLSMLNPELLGIKMNVEVTGGKYTIIDAWGDPLHYRHDPEGKDPEMMNPPSDFDLWSLGPDGVGGPTGTKKERSDDIKNW